jgi:hypothetical protein
MSKRTHEELESDSVLFQPTFVGKGMQRAVSRREKRLRKNSKHSNTEEKKIRSVSQFRQEIESLTGIKMPLCKKKVGAGIEIVLGSENISLPGRAIGTFSVSAKHLREAENRLWSEVKGYLDYLSRTNQSLSLTCRLACKKS